MILPTHSRAADGQDPAGSARPAGSTPVPAAGHSAGDVGVAGNRTVGLDAALGGRWPWLTAGELRSNDLVQLHGGVCRVVHTEILPDPYSAIPGTLRVRITHLPHTPPGIAPSDTGADVDWFTTADVTPLPVLHRYQPACHNGVWHAVDTHTPNHHYSLPALEGGDGAAVWRMAVLLEGNHREQQGRQAEIRLRIFADLSCDHQQIAHEAEHLAARRDLGPAPAGKLGAWAQIRRCASIQAARGTVPGAAQMGVDWQTITELSADVLREWPNTPRGLIPGPAAILTAWGRPEGLQPGDHVTHLDAACNGLKGVGVIIKVGHDPNGDPTATVDWPDAHSTDPDRTPSRVSFRRDLRTTTPPAHTQD